jgi:hypothetical protein
VINIPFKGWSLADAVLQGSPITVAGPCRSLTDFPILPGAVHTIR